MLCAGERTPTDACQPSVMRAMTASSLPVAASPEELTRARSNTNALFSLGVVTGVAAVSYGSLQVFTDGQRIVFHGRF